jgi:hypothetical protein
MFIGLQDAHNAEIPFDADEQENKGNKHEQHQCREGCTHLKLEGRIRGCSLLTLLFDSRGKTALMPLDKLRNLAFGERLSSAGQKLLG